MFTTSLSKFFAWFVFAQDWCLFYIKNLSTNLNSWSGLASWTFFLKCSVLAASMCLVYSLHIIWYICLWTVRLVFTYFLSNRLFSRLSFLSSSLYQGACGLKIIFLDCNGACLLRREQSISLYWSIMVSRSLPARLLSDEVAMSSLNFSISTFRSLRYFTLLWVGAGRGRSTLQSTRLWSEGNSRRVFTFEIKLSAQRVMIRSRVRPSRWVGPSTCCRRPAESSKSRKFLASVLVGLSTWKLKSSARMSLLGVAISSSRNFESSEKNCGLESLFLWATNWNKLATNWKNYTKWPVLP